MNRRRFITLCGASVGSLTGCLEDAPRSGGGGKTPASDQTSAETRYPETPTPSSQDSERNASPHEFVRVVEVRDRSKVAATGENETALFRNLGPRRRRTFSAALGRERVAADGWSYYNASRPEYVRYEGRWYRVIVGVH